ncbi:MAG: hypothetical protein GX287_03610 [Fusobacteria bacterium]|nr:hypothetical protein [Fusobacteriota bacterium]
MNEFEFCITIGNEIVINLLKKYYINNYEEITDKNSIKEIEKHYKDLLKLYNKILYFIENKNNKTKINNDEVYEVFLKLSILINENNINIDTMKKNYDLRKLNINESGALYVKNLLNKKLSEYKDLIKQIEKKELLLYDEHKKISLAFENTIQEEESSKIMSEMIKCEKKLKVILEKKNNIKNIIKKIENQLNEKWHYEIYGILNYRELEK